MFAELEIRSICAQSMLPGELGDAVSESLAREVPHDGYCFFGFDPATGMTSFHASRDGYRHTLRDCNRLWQNELLEKDLHRFSDLALQSSPVGLLGTGHPDEARSARRHEIMPGAGYGAEMRVALAEQGTLWGALVLLRERGRRPFHSIDASRVINAATPLAHAARRLCLARQPAAAGLSPAVAILDGDNAVEELSPEAERWFVRLDREYEAGTLPIALSHVANAARRAAIDPGVPMPRCRARAANGEHAILYASLLGRHARSRVAVVIEPDVSETQLPALLQRYGLSGREQDVARLLLEGRATKDIARRLRLSPHTVNDHLKSIFRKVGIRGRHQIIAALSR